MNAFLRLFLFSLTLALLSSGCTSDEPETGPTCNAGDTQFCVCTTGAMGEQECAGDGATWLPCLCGSNPVEDTTGPTDTAGSPDTTNAPDTASPPDVVLPPPVDTGTTPTPPTGNNQCSTDADCAEEGKCHEDAAMGCKCVTNQQGTNRCLAVCETTEDCPTPKKQGITLGCNQQGVCTKKAGEEQSGDDNGENDNGGNNSGVLSNCTSQTDCDADGGCPNDAAKGCSCITTNNGGQKCVPLCEEDKDCPTSLSVDMICGTQQGHCVPDNGDSGQDPGMGT